MFTRAVSQDQVINKTMLTILLALEWVGAEIPYRLDSVLDHCCIGSEGNSFNVTSAITGKINEIFSRIFEKTFSKVIHSQSKIVIQNNNTPHHKF